MAEFDASAELGMRQCDFLTPEQAGLHDVRFFHRTDTAIPATRDFESNTRNTFDFRVRVDRRVIPPAQSAFLINAARRAEIDTPCQLSDDHDVQAFDHFRLQAGGADQCRETESGPQVRKNIEAFAQSQQASFRALVARRTRPFRPTNRAEQNRIRSTGLLQRILVQRRPVGIKGCSANKPLFQQEVWSQNVHQAPNFGHNFWANPVSWQ